MHPTYCCNLHVISIKFTQAAAKFTVGHWDCPLDAFLVKESSNDAN